MSRIKSSNTRPELLLRKFLFSSGFRYRLNVKNLPGKPDIVLPKYKTAIFVNGCFWHGHENCKYFVVPKTRTDWWLEKIVKNRDNDKRKMLQLKKQGWHVIVIWECSLNSSRMYTTLFKLLQTLDSR